MNMEISDVAINNPKGCIELLFMNIIMQCCNYTPLYRHSHVVNLCNDVTHCAWLNVLLLTDKDRSHEKMHSFAL